MVDPSGFPAYIDPCISTPGSRRHGCSATDGTTPMKKRKQLFLQMLVMELEDLQSDLQINMDRYKADYDNGRISADTFYSNAEWIQNEITALEGLYEQAVQIKPDDYLSVEQMAIDLEQWLQEWCRKSGLDQNARDIVNRKTEKVFTYFERSAAMI
jgi:hypothetical protein